MATIPAEKYDAVIFDMDGVVTDTASTHMAAWRRLFDDYLRERSEQTGEPFEPFTEEDYLTYVDGKPRYDGVESFLASRGITLPHGDPSDPEDADTVCGLGNRKNRHFRAQIEEEGVVPYQTTFALIDALHEAGVRTALISSSKNAELVLGAVDALRLFEARVDGVVGAELGLPGKPDPAYFEEAARRLGTTPARSVVVEDAISGVEAGRRGEFGLVIGVDRTGRPEGLAEFADVVVSDLGEVEVA